MRITLTGVIFSGIAASIAITFFLYLIPQLLGAPPIDLIGQVGSAFSAESPTIPGIAFLAVLGIVYSIVFAMLYDYIPGGILIKGTIYGISAGVISLFILPTVMATIDSMFGAPGQFASETFVLTTQSLLSVIAFSVLGITLASTYQPADAY